MTPQEFFEKDRFADNADVELIEIKEGYGRARLAIMGKRLGAGSRTQSGALFTLAGLTLAVATNSRDTLAFPFSSSIIFLRSSSLGNTLYAGAHGRYTGRSAGYYQIDIINQKGELVTTFEPSAFRKEDTLPFAIPP